MILAHGPRIIRREAMDYEPFGLEVDLQASVLGIMSGTWQRMRLLPITSPPSRVAAWRAEIIDDPLYSIARQLSKAIRDCGCQQQLVFSWTSKLFLSRECFIRGGWR
jgi:hypothetical protein